LLEKRQQKADTAALDRAENAKVKQRSGGQCEMKWPLWDRDARPSGFKRCPLRASHVHHLISGIGRRNVGKSIESAHKLHLCERCHSEIHAHVLVPLNAYEREDAATVRYERVR
jgi:hypothetical protein